MKTARLNKVYRSDYIRIQQQIMEYQEEAREALKDARIKELEELLAARQ